MSFLFDITLYTILYRIHISRNGFPLEFILKTNVAFHANKIYCLTKKGMKIECAWLMVNIVLLLSMHTFI